MASIPKDIVEKHNQLLVDLCENMDIDDAGYKQFIMYLKNTDLPPGRLARVQRDPTDLFELMNQKGKLKVGDYSVLEKALEKSGLNVLLDIVRVKGRHITKLLQSQSPTANVMEETTREGDDSPHKTITSEAKDDGNWSGNVYDRGRKKGLLLILNFTEEREGTHLDVSALKTFFEDTLKFDVEDPRQDKENDLTLSELDEALEHAKSLLNLQAKKYYCFFCAVLSHGNERGIRCGDGQFKNVDDIMKTFTNDKIKNFVGRPKVFLIQACRGDAIQKDHPVADDWPRAISDVTGKITVPTEADVLIAYATTPGNKAWRYENIGSWFMHVTISVFETCHKKEHVEEMFIKVKDEIAHDEKWKPRTGERMMPCTWSTLTKKLMI
ncbi:hypothetical protein CHS0354_009748 [Potamilus streckersoni]|uniref:Uncharacterized protein n=1 Tax=Potamilus streckersoni TaxID=2493646 RepID=A0AAE0TI96_9BIVA|nr:hypothetical protein CHS0354_009748 [Potamilus streckersoni]